MYTKEIKEKLRGPLTALITPMRENYEVDYEGLRILIRNAKQAGFGKGKGAIMVCGAGGEGIYLTDEERWKVLETAVDEAKGEVPILMGINEFSTKKTIEAINTAGKIGALACQVAPPHYWPATDEDIIQFFKDLSKGIRENVGVMVYNCWFRGGYARPEVLAKIAEFDHIVGVKWSTPLPWEHSDITLFANKLVVIDDTTLHVEAYLYGANGNMSAMGDHYPIFDIQQWERMESGKYEEWMKEWIRAALPFRRFRGKIKKRVMGESPTKKAACYLMGLPGGPPRPPLRPLNEEEINELREILKKAGLPVVR